MATSVALASGWVNAAEPRFVVVVHPGTSESALDREFVADVFLKKKTRWPGGGVVFPIDQRTSTVVRRHFSEDVLRRSVEAVRNYWQQKIFSGRDVPPPEVDSDAEVIRYVQSRPGAIGYVSADVSVSGVRVVGVR